MDAYLTPRSWFSHDNTFGGSFLPLKVGEIMDIKKERSKRNEQI